MKKLLFSTAFIVGMSMFLFGESNYNFTGTDKVYTSQKDQPDGYAGIDEDGNVIKAPEIMGGLDKAKSVLFNPPPPQLPTDPQGDWDFTVLNATATIVPNKAMWIWKTNAGAYFNGNGVSIVTVTWTSHGFVTGSTLNIQGIYQKPSYCGQFPIVVDNANQFHYTYTPGESGVGAGFAQVWRQVDWTIENRIPGTVTIVNSTMTGIPGVTFTNTSSTYPLTGAGATTPDLAEIPWVGPWTMIVVGQPWSNIYGNKGYFGLDYSNTIDQKSYSGKPISRNAHTPTTVINDRPAYHYWNTFIVLKVGNPYIQVNDEYSTNDFIAYPYSNAGHFAIQKLGTMYPQGIFRVSYILFYNRELTDTEIYQAWGYLNNYLAPKGIDLTYSRPPLSKTIEPNFKPGGLLTKPYMGWASFGRFVWSSGAQIVKDTALAIKNLGLDNYGYNYVINDGIVNSTYDKPYRDIYGKATNIDHLFPSGIKDVVDYVHALGLKYGHYSLTSGNQPGLTTNDYYVFVGSEEREFQDAQDFADYGIDFLKYDTWGTNSRYLQRLDAWGINSLTESYSQMALGLKSTGRPILFNAAVGAGRSPYANVMRKYGACSARITTDLAHTTDTSYPKWNITAASWNHTTKTLTKTAGFATYTYVSGDVIRIISGTGVVPGIYSIASKVSDNALTLASEITSAGTDPSDVAVNGDPLAGIGRGIGIWTGIEAQFAFYDTASTTTYPLNDSRIQASWTGPGMGYFPDPDWLVVPDYLNGTINPLGLTAVEGRTSFNFWCMLAAPLVLDTDLRTLQVTDPTYTIITNTDLINIDQDLLCWQAIRVGHDLHSATNTDVWAKPLSDGSWAIGFFNRDGSNTRTIEVDWSEIYGAINSAYTWNKVDPNISNYPSFANAQPTTIGTTDLSGNSLTISLVGGGATGVQAVNVPIHGCAIIKVKP